MPRRRRLNESDDNTDALESTLWYPHLRPTAVFQFSVIHAATKENLGHAQPALSLLEDSAYTTKHFPAFTQAWITEHQTEDISVWAVAMLPARCGALNEGDNVCLSQRLGAEAVVVHGRVVAMHYRPRDNRTAWAEIAVHEMLEA